MNARDPNIVRPDKAIEEEHPSRTIFAAPSRKPAPYTKGPT